MRQGVSDLLETLQVLTCVLPQKDCSANAGGAGSLETRDEEQHYMS